MPIPEYEEGKWEQPVVDNSDELVLDDKFDSDTVKYVAIGGVATILGAISVIAAKRLRDKGKE